ncbi:MAG: D-tyrosyl-tRNA(Tyr) deacylase [Planctomycetes bacterium]|nr:D-tyrosyl-tRNA(Tyr) deacylase [Planctomycetota bacterium]
MKAVVQRVGRARVRVEGSTVGEIEAGMLVLLGVLKGDGEKECDELAAKIAQFRFFGDENGKMNLSALDLGRQVLVVSQFTLAADGSSGRRPSFDRAAPPAVAEPLYERFVEALRGFGLQVATGRFGALMQVELVNDGPVTFVLEVSAGR